MDVPRPARIHARLPLVLALVSALSAGCAQPGQEVSFAFPRAGAAFLDTPYPSDLLLREDGKLNLAAFPNPGGSDLLESYLSLISGAGGWSTASALYFRVDGGVDEASLPADPAASLARDASLFLRPLSDPDARVPVEWRHYPEGTPFLPAGTVAVRPVPGATFEGPVALIVTDRARDASGGTLQPARDLRRLLACEPVDVDLDCAPYQRLAEETPRPIALAQIVTPRDATTELRRAAAALRAEHQPTVQGGLELIAIRTFYDEYRGVLDIAKFLRGAPPYTVFDGVTGSVEPRGDGGFVQQDTELVDFVLTLPKTDLPDAGYPIAIYSHGTGGSLESPLGERAGDPARRLAAAGWAMIAISEPLHTGRVGFRAGQEELLTFNFLNPVAGRDVWRQSVLEKVQLVSAVESLVVPGGLVGGVEQPTVTFDPSRVGFLGHSQGGIVGAVTVAVEPRVQAAFLSGAGASFAISLVEKTEPFVLAEVMATLLSLEGDTLDRFHPVPNLVQIWIDEADPLAYGAVLRAPDGPAPHLVATAGLLDPFTPKGTQVALTGAYRLPLIAPVAERFEIVDLLDIGVTAGPVAVNATAPGGRRVTRGLLQYPDDGHFAIFNNPDAQTALTAFFATAILDTPVARVR